MNGAQSAYSTSGRIHILRLPLSRPRGGEDKTFDGDDAVSIADRR